MCARCRAAAFTIVSSRTIYFVGVVVVLLCLGVAYPEVEAATSETEAKLAKLVKIFSKPGAFNQIDAIFGEDDHSSSSSSSHKSSSSSSATSSCPEGEEGLECRRAEARRSVDCPRGDCYCYNCSRAGPELWASCCRESLKCCSHLAAACRTCDQPPLYPFCAKHFKKCLGQLNEKKHQLP